MATAPIAQAEPVLLLTPQERDLFAVVLRACATIDTPVQVRVAGGWVRDKLLGLESHDIDFALDTMSGEEFAGKLSAFISSEQQSQQAASDGAAAAASSSSASAPPAAAKAPTVGVIKANPDQSKHLETATMMVHGISIDLNRFREEIYDQPAEDAAAQAQGATSRIPTIRPSTAQEDALRRDFTINALFYNLHTSRIEDHVGGLDDLRKGVLRTPRDPRKTFSDDPLRILRAARFSARYGDRARVHDDIAAAARLPHVHHDLSLKVSRERMGIECDKMLKSPDSAFHAFTLLCEWGLRRIVFEVPTEFLPATDTEVGSFSQLRMDGRVVPVAAGGAVEAANVGETAGLTSRCLQGMGLAHQHLTTHSSQYTAAESSALLLSSFLIPYHGYRVPAKDKKGQPNGQFNTLAWFVVRESLRLTQREAGLASDLLIQAHHFIRASCLHEYVSTVAASAPSAATAAAPASASASAAAAGSAAPHASVSASDTLQLVTARVLRSSGTYSRVALDLARIILETVPLGEQLLPTATAVFDMSLALPASFHPQPVKAQARFQAYRQWIEQDSLLMKMPVWNMPAFATLDWQMLHPHEMLPVCQDQQARQAEADTAHVPTAKAPVAPTASVSASVLTPVQEACYAWLKQQPIEGPKPKPKPTKPSKPGTG